MVCSIQADSGPRQYLETPLLVGESEEWNIWPGYQTRSNPKGTRSYESSHLWRLCLSKLELLPRTACASGQTRFCLAWRPKEAQFASAEPFYTWPSSL